MNFRVGLQHSTAVLAALSLALAGCGGGGGSGNTPGGPATPVPTPAPTASRLFSNPAADSLSVENVEQIITQAVGEARARNVAATIAVVDRVGNVLAVFDMNGSRRTLRTSSLISFLGRDNDVPIDLQGNANGAVEIPARAGAIAKAVTGAYLSSSGNAFSTRTASQIVQQHFPPAPITPGLESGPLFGVQFSSLPCSDLNARFNPAGGSLYVDPVTGAQVTSAQMIGPKRSPLGLAADAGGFPLYSRNGVVIGGIGVMADGDYSFDPNVLDIDNDAEEFIALAGIQGFAPSDDILADRISVDGSLLRFTDARTGGLSSLQTNFAAINNVVGSLVSVPGYYTAAARPLAGAIYGTPASGYEPAPAGAFNSSDIFILTNGAGVNRFPIRGGTDAATVTTPISAAEAKAILEEGFGVMAAGRAQIRRPLDSRIQVTLSLVDTNGQILGVIRSPDAPIFGTDVSLQKARSVNLFSHPRAAADLTGATGGLPAGEIAAFVQRFRTFLGDPTALTGTVAYSDRAIGNLARPYYPDGEVGRPPGPLSRPIEDFNPFAVGLQVQLVLLDLAAHVGFVNGGATDIPQRCTGLPDTLPGRNRLQNGLQIFAGATPVYRNGQLVGALGISGDGIDQDDMISFLGVHRGGLRMGNGLGLPPKPIRADTVIPPGTNTRLRFVNCPFAPFLGTTEQNVCEGL
ncbi:MAG: hypothetical protein ABW194_05100 [Novosphingobium sp.]